jgi:hypothetical protein
MEAKRCLILAILIGILRATLNITGTSQSVQRFKPKFYALRAEPFVNLTLAEVEPDTLWYRDTTNPYKNWYNGDPINELSIVETPYTWKVKNVVLALDEEAVDKWGIDYTVRTIERADEALIHNYGIDLKISKIVTYESDDSIEWMNPEDCNPGAPTLYEEAFSLFKSEFDGKTDIIIVITGQDTKDYWNLGLAPSYPILGSNTLVLARFEVYWVDDNLIQHEVSHCFGLGDHFEDVDVWCVMAYKTELLYIDWIVEDGKWFGPYNAYVKRALLTYDYCSHCHQLLKYLDAGHYTGGNPSRPFPSPI